MTQPKAVLSANWVRKYRLSRRPAPTMGVTYRQVIGDILDGMPLPKAKRES